MQPEYVGETEAVVLRMKAGEYFGEVALLSSHIRRRSSRSSATGAALADAVRRGSETEDDGDDDEADDSTSAASDGVRTANVTCETNCIFLTLTRATFEKFLQVAPEVKDELLASALERQAHTDEIKEKRFGSLSPTTQRLRISQAMLMEAVEHEQAGVDKMPTTQEEVEEVDHANSDSDADDCEQEETSV